FKNIVDQLAAWATSQKINASKREEFQKKYLEYTGSDEEINEDYFHVYKEGITLLAAILELLNDESIPLDARKNTTINLLDGLLVCGPGTYTNIQLAYTELLSYKNSPTFWMKLKEDVVIDQTLTILREDVQEYSEEEQQFLDLDNMETHYATGTL